jgi:predicted lipoprotein
MNKNIKYGIGLVLLLFLAYNSVYFTDLDKMKSEDADAIDFNAKATQLYEGIIAENTATDLNTLKAALSTQSDSAFANYGNRLGIGESAYFMVNVAGKVQSINDGEILIQTEAGESITVQTKFIFGNAIRDASGLVALTDYKTNADFNKLSEALNTIIREQKLPKAVQEISVGDVIKVEGALKLSKGQPLNTQLEILPVLIEK